MYNDGKNYDFGYDPVMFGNHSFIHAPGSLVPNVSTSGPVQLFDHFHNDINMKFIGIQNRARTATRPFPMPLAGCFLPPFPLVRVQIIGI